MDDLAKLVAVFVLASFASERVLAGTRWLLDSERVLRIRREVMVKARARGRRKALLLALSGAIALLIIDKADLRVMRLVDARHAPPILDYWMTWLVLFAGADRVRELLQGAPKPPAAPKATPGIRIEYDDRANVVKMAS